MLFRTLGEGCDKRFVKVCRDSVKKSWILRTLTAGSKMMYLQCIYGQKPSKHSRDDLKVWSSSKPFLLWRDVGNQRCEVIEKWINGLYNGWEWYAITSPRILSVIMMCDHVCEDMMSKGDWEMNESQGRSKCDQRAKDDARDYPRDKGWWQMLSVLLVCVTSWNSVIYVQEWWK
jgi:hypothetical protein